MYRIAHDSQVENRQQQLRVEAEAARLASRIHRPEPRVEHRVRSALSLRPVLAR